MPVTGLVERRRHVFNSVFKAHEELLSDPTPVTTPASTFVVPGQPFGRFQASGSQHLTNRPLSFQSLRASVDSHADASRHVQDQVTWDRSWHAVTSWLSFDKEKFVPYGPAMTEGFSAPSPAPPNITTALLDILTPETRVPYAAHRQDLLKWLSQHMRSHFLRSVQPWLANTIAEYSQEILLKMTFEVLARARRLYLDSVSDVLGALNHICSPLSKSLLQGLERDFQAIARNSVPEPIWKTVEWYLYHAINIILAIPHISNDKRICSNKQEQEAARRDLLNFIQMLRNCGLGGERFQIMVAEVMNASMSAYVYGTYSHVWNGEPSTLNAEKVRSHRQSQRFRSSLIGSTSVPNDEEPLVPRVVNHTQPSRCVRDLCTWIEDEYARLAVEVLSTLDSIEVAYSDLEKWKEMGIGRLADLRTSELFDIVVNWPNSRGALDDLRTSITTPRRRLQLTDAFTVDLKARLLHPGASTLQILRTYIAMIWSFHALDHSKVLLDRVAYSLQVYLCSRENTVRIIITGLLADTKDADGNDIEPGGDKLVELAILLNKGLDTTQGPDDDMDWNDMEWIPEPVDAGPGYKRRKNADVIGTLIGVLGSQEVFIKEFQTIIGENLLRHDGDFDREITVLELLKTRFGEASLQSCEVMIKDIQDSRRLNGAIRRAQKLDPSAEEITTAGINAMHAENETVNPEGLLKPSLHAKILSRLFWPQLHDEQYKIPDNIAQLQQRYEQGFETLKNARKLTWLHALGSATVEIELTDRTIYEKVHTFQAAVISEFQGAQQGSEPVTRSIEYLEEHLQMDEDLLRSALKFWVGKMVLHEIRSDEFAVLETLNPEDRERNNAQAAAAASSAEGTADDGPPKESAMSEDKMTMYWQYIQGMLKNSVAQMPVQQIGMMLKMLIVEGFPYSNDELAEYLSTKIAAGELEIVGGKYRLVRK